MTKEKSKKILQNGEPEIRSRIFFKENLNESEPVIRTRTKDKE